MEDVGQLLFQANSEDNQFLMGFVKFHSNLRRAIPIQEALQKLYRINKNLSTLDEDEYKDPFEI